METTSGDPSGRGNHVQRNWVRANKDQQNTVNSERPKPSQPKPPSEEPSSNQRSRLNQPNRGHQAKGKPTKYEGESRAPPAQLNQVTSGDNPTAKSDQGQPTAGATPISRAVSLHLTTTTQTRSATQQWTNRRMRNPDHQGSRQPTAGAHPNFQTDKP